MNPATQTPSPDAQPSRLRRSAAIAAESLADLLLGRPKPLGFLLRVPLLMLLGAWLVSKGYWGLVLAVPAVLFAWLWSMAHSTMTLLERVAAREERRLRAIAVTHPERVFGQTSVMQRREGV